jgi:ribosomal protein S18 acetylase RimI-like enzyme
VEGNSGIRPRSLVWATSIDVLPIDHVVERRDGYLVVRSPGNPTHWWGNLLVFDRPPRTGDRARWERRFAAEFADQPRSIHHTFVWDAPGPGEAAGEFAGHGYDLERNVGLVATPDQVRPHPRANADVQVRALDPRPGHDEDLWGAVVEIQVADRDAERFDIDEHRAFCQVRMDDIRTLLMARAGAWYVALAAGGEPVGSCGLIVTDGRARYQAVDTMVEHRRRGICSRLIVDAARDAAAHHGARTLVIVADPDYHALGIYASVGFSAEEETVGVCRAPQSAMTRQDRRAVRTAR